MHDAAGAPAPGSRPPEVVSASDEAAELLSSRQCCLLEELCGAAESALAGDEHALPSVLEYGDLYCRLRRASVDKVKRPSLWDSRSCWSWVLQFRDLNATASAEAEALLDTMDELQRQHNEAVRRTQELHRSCGHSAADEGRLGGVAEAIEQRLKAFMKAPALAATLDRGTALESAATFVALLDELEGAVAYIASHQDFASARSSLQDLDHLRLRACVSLRTSFQRSMERAAACVEQDLEETDDEGVARAFNAQMLYSPFMAYAFEFKPLIAVLRERVGVHDRYASILDEVEACYVSTRSQVLRGPVMGQLHSSLAAHARSGRLEEAVRETAVFVTDIADLEQQCFFAFFEGVRSRQALDGLLQQLSGTYYSFLGPAASTCASVQALSRAAACVQGEFLEPAKRRYGDGIMDSPAPVLITIQKLHAQLQCQLLSSTQLELSSHVANYKASEQDLDYPALLVPSRAEAKEFQRGWYSPVKRVLDLLVTTYRVLDMKAFDGFARDAMTACIVSLRRAADGIARRPSAEPPDPLLYVVQRLDSLLFLTKHLLILREQLAVFEYDSTVATPSGRHAEVDAELGEVCKAFVVELAGWVVRPLSVAEAQAAHQGLALSEYLGRQPTAAKDAASAYLEALRQWVPVALAHMRMYIGATTSSPSTGGGEEPSSGSGAAQSNQAVSTLFRALQARLLHRWRQFWELDLPEAHRKDIASRKALLGPDALAPTELDGLLNTFLEQCVRLPWDELVAVVFRVKRSSPTPLRPAAGAEAQAIASPCADAVAADAAETFGSPTTGVGILGSPPDSLPA